MKYLLIFAAMVGGGFAADAQDVTYANDIAKIIYKNCSSCHRAGEIGPMSLTNYEEVKDWATTIKSVTQSKYMPPWQPDPIYSRLQAENYLSDIEIADIAAWVDGGMPRGNQADEPAFPEFPDGSVLGTPDLVLEMAEPFLHRGNGQDNYRYFVIPSGLTEDKIVKAVEFRPDNTKIVHHALIFEDVTGVAAAKDDATPEYGFDGFGSFLDGNDDSILSQKQYPGYVPGQKPLLYPDGVGQVLQAGADVVIQLHYAPWSVDEYDQSKINIFFADEQELIEREVETHIMVPFQEVINADFFIPANQKREFHGIWNVSKDVSFMGLSPHMHLLGQHWEVYLEHADGKIENLIRINKWDFNWQGGYSFRKYITAKAGAKIHAIASYDNTASNPNNPSNPPQFVTWGEGTEDEMYYLPLNFVEYQAGDENIVFEDEITSTNSGIVVGGDYIEPLSPNPVDDFTVAKFSLSQGKAIDINILDINGRFIRKIRDQEFFNTGDQFVNFSTKQLNNGIYILNIQGRNLNISQKFVKQ